VADPLGITGSVTVDYHVNFGGNSLTVQMMPQQLEKAVTGWVHSSTDKLEQHGIIQSTTHFSMFRLPEPYGSFLGCKSGFYNNNLHVTLSLLS